MIRKLAAITQRVDVVERYSERRDALDQAWAELLRSHNFDLLPLPNNPEAATALMARAKPDVLVLSGGSGAIPSDGIAVPERNETEKALIAIAAAERLPLFGVCRGMQMLNLHFGGTLRQVEGHIGVPHEVAAPGGKNFVVNSFHGLGIDQSDLSADLEPLLLAPDGTIEAVRHRTLPWLAVMWHPERPAPGSPVLRAIVAAGLAGTFDPAILS